VVFCWFVTNTDSIHSHIVYFKFYFIYIWFVFWLWVETGCINYRTLFKLAYPIVLIQTRWQFNG